MTTHGENSVALDSPLGVRITPPGRRPCELGRDRLGERHHEVPIERGSDRARVSIRFRGPPPSSSREITDWVVPIRSASSRWLNPASVRRS